MLAVPRSEAVPDPGLGAGIALVLKAEDTQDWNPLTDWLARNPGLAEQLAGFLAARRGITPSTPQQASQVRTGSQVGGLELREEIGRGAMGIVYQAFDPVLNRNVAVKMVRTGDVLSATDSARFRFEAEVVASLDHENIVPVLSFGESNGDPYLVMPLMSGGSLADRLKQRGSDRRFTPAEAAELVSAIAVGIHHAHQRGLIHRDLKPGNVLLDKDDVPRIADFGLARHLNVTVSVSGTIAGTAAYMAPEQARGEAGLTTAVDVHALGAILFELLTGRTPFGSGDLASVLRRVIENPAPPLREFRPDVEKDLEAICLKCLEKRAEARYATAQDLADDLGCYLRGGAVKARQPGFWDWLRQLARTRPEVDTDYSWPVTVWFGVAALVANIVIYALVRNDGSTLGVWAANVSSAAAMMLVLWWYMLRRFRRLPITERHSLIIAAGMILVYFPLLVAYVPLSAEVPARDVMGLYPPLGALSGLALFILGSTNWSRFFLIGLGMMSLTPVMLWWPEESPLVYGGAIALVMWYWAATKKNVFGHTPSEPHPVVNPEKCTTIGHTPSDPHATVYPKRASG